MVVPTQSGPLLLAVAGGKGVIVSVVVAEAAWHKTAAAVHHGTLRGERGLLPAVSVSSHPDDEWQKSFQSGRVIYCEGLGM